MSGTILAGRLAAWAAGRPDAPAYTFVDHRADPAGVPRTLTWSQLHRRVHALAGRLRATTTAGDRVAVVAPSGLEYVVALLAAWHAGVVAVPLVSSGADDRVTAVLADCAPVCVLTTRAEADKVRHDRLVVIDEPHEPHEPHPPAPDPIDPDAVAYLQYTSGSTRRPAGVEITHRNLTANVTQLWTACAGGRTRYSSVNWIPLHHDMGLIASVGLPLLHGTDAVLFDPAAFLMRPVRWLRLLSEVPHDTCTAAPNFAYDYCLRRIRDRDIDGLDLSRVRVWLNGAEPVRATTLDRFAARFRPVGVDPAALRPAYGLAEATVFVTAARAGGPVVTGFDRAALAAGHARRSSGDDVSTLVSCGGPTGQRVAVVDPDTCHELPDGRVGEIWVHGPNVARRYWRQPESSAATFEAELVDDRAGPWLRTGDLGVRLDGELYVTGRRKDLLIVAGRNHYPDDVEHTVTTAVPELAGSRVAAFTVPGDDGERLVLVVESARPADPVAVREAVWRRHGLAVHDVVPARPGAVPVTSSGKVSRHLCRQRHLDGYFRPA